MKFLISRGMLYVIFKSAFISRKLFGLIAANYAGSKSIIRSKESDKKRWPLWTGLVHHFLKSLLAETLMIGTSSWIQFLHFDSLIYHHQRHRRPSSITLVWKEKRRRNCFPDDAAQTTSLSTSDDLLSRSLHTVLFIQPVWVKLDFLYTTIFSKASWKFIIIFPRVFTSRRTLGPLMSNQTGGTRQSSCAWCTRRSRLREALTTHLCVCSSFFSAVLKERGSPFPIKNDEIEIAQRRS